MRQWHLDDLHLVRSGAQGMPHANQTKGLVREAVSPWTRRRWRQFWILTLLGHLGLGRDRV
jgi:hypothetical protein